MMRNLLGIALAGFLMLGVAGSAGAATVSWAYTGLLTFGLTTLPSAPGTGVGTYVGPTHISTIGFTAGQFGPIQVSLPVTSSGTIQSVRISGLANSSGTFTGLSAGAPAGGTMGISGMAKICLVFAPACGNAVPVPLTPTAGTGMGVGGTNTFPGAVALTMKHAPWTIGQPANIPPTKPTFTVHTPNSTIETPTLPVGIQSPFSSTASSGVLQLVAVTKVFTSLTTAFPEIEVFAILRLPEPGSLLMMISAAGAVLLVGGLRSRRRKR